jgi:hypothetical protein
LSLPFQRFCYKETKDIIQVCIPLSIHPFILCLKANSVIYFTSTFRFFTISTMRSFSVNNLKSTTALLLILHLIPTAIPADPTDDDNRRRLPPGGNGRAQGNGQGRNNDSKSFWIDRYANIAGTARQAKIDKKNVLLSGLGISPPGHLVVATPFSAGCRVTGPDGSSQPCDTGRIVLTSSAEEATFTVLSTDEATGKTTGYSMSSGKKFFRVNQEKNRDVDVDEATDEAFVPPAWGCENEIAGHAAEDKEKRRRLLGHSHSHNDNGHE